MSVPTPESSWPLTRWKLIALTSAVEVIEARRSSGLLLSEDETPICSVPFETTVAPV